MKERDEQLFQLLRLSLGVSQDFPVALSDKAWKELYRLAGHQSVIAVCHAGVRQLQPPFELALRWAFDAETTCGLNKLLNGEAARLTRLFAEAGRRTAILKGQANARLYPDPMARQPGDIDIWVEGGKKSVLSLISSSPQFGGGPEIVTYHHAHLPITEKGVEVEVHFRPSSGNYNVLSNRRLQRWLEQEIAAHSTEVAEGFRVPSVSFALIMQMSHIQRHFFEGGMELRLVCDYYYLLQHAQEEERRNVAAQLKRLGLHHTAGALMWVLRKVLLLDEGLLLCPPDSYRGEWLLQVMMVNGNLGQYAGWLQYGVWRRFLMNKKRQIGLMRFDFWEAFWMLLDYWKWLAETIPQRLRYRTLSQRDALKKENKTSWIQNITKSPDTSSK